MNQGANSGVQKDYYGSNQTLTTNTKVPIYSSLPERAFSEQGSIAFDKSTRTLAYFDGLAWIHLDGISFTNIGNGAQIFDFNKVGRFRSVVGEGAISVKQEQDKIVISSDIADNQKQSRDIADKEDTVNSGGNSFNSSLNTNYVTTGSGDGWETINTWTTSTVGAQNSGNVFPTAPGWGVSGVDGSISSVSFTTPGVYKVVAVLDFDDSLTGSKQVYARIHATRGFNNWAPSCGRIVPHSSNQINTITLQALINQPPSTASTQVFIELYVTNGDPGDTHPVVQAAAPITDALTNPGSFFSVTLVQHT